MNSDENTQVESVAACSLVCGNQKHLIVIYFWDTIQFKNKSVEEGLQIIS